MGKRKAAQQAPISKSKNLKTFNCPKCRSAGTVKVRLSKKGAKQEAVCVCSACEQKYGLANLPLIYTEKNAYMKWVEIIEQMKRYSVKCSSVNCGQREIMLKIITGSDGYRQGCTECPECGTRYCQLLDNETREELCQRVKSTKVKFYFEPLLQGGVLPQRRGDETASQKRQEKETRATQQKAQEESSEEEGHQESESDKSLEEEQPPEQEAAAQEEDDI